MVRAPDLSQFLYKDTLVLHFRIYSFTRFQFSGGDLDIKSITMDKFDLDELFALRVNKIEYVCLESLATIHRFQH